MKPLRKQAAARMRIHVHNHNPEEKGHSLKPDFNCEKCSMATTKGQSFVLSFSLGWHMELADMNGRAGERVSGSRPAGHPFLGHCSPRSPAARPLAHCVPSHAPRSSGSWYDVPHFRPTTKIAVTEGDPSHHIGRLLRRWRSSPCGGGWGNVP